MLLHDVDLILLKVKSGETVQELRRRLQANHGIPFSSSSLFFQGKCMLDPLSLNDIAGVVDNSGVASIEVKVFTITSIILLFSFYHFPYSTNSKYRSTDAITYHLKNIDC